MSARSVSVEDLVELLRSAEGAPITSDRIAGLLQDVEIDEGSLRPFVRYADDHYTRNLIHRDRWFDVMTLCWKPGQGTPVHTHNGQLGWAKVLRGAIECTEYAWLGCDRPENQDVAGLDCLAGGAQVKLDAHEPAICVPGSPVNRVTRRVTIHSLGVPRDCTEPSVSLHVYSLPFDSCVTFDVARGACWRRNLSFDSKRDGYDVPLRP
ncbi:MAG: cysteine dioxygenase family protein [Planctomycetes bacterium]|nr:cysteine dioxygenase family protein [Planctomycetota bacterium]